MPGCTPAWMKHPEWPADEFQETRAVAWFTLIDTIKKSMMSNDPDRGNILSSKNAIAGMIEARKWLMDWREEFPEDRLNLHHCVVASQIGNVTLKRILRHLWLRQRDGIGITLRGMARTAREGIQAELRAKKCNKPKRGPVKNHTAMLNLCMKAQSVHKRSNKWAGVK